MLDSKDPAEIVPITFDFSELVTSIDSIVQVTCADPSGTDAAATAMLDGSPVVAGQLVIQRIKNGIHNVNYTLRAEILSGSLKYALTDVLPVLKQG